MKRQSAFSAILKSIGFALLFTAVQLVAVVLVELILMIRIGGMNLDFEAMQTALMNAYYSKVYETMLLSALFYLGVFVLMYLPPKKNPLRAASIRRTRPIHVFACIFGGFAAFLAVSYLVTFLQMFPAYGNSANDYMDSVENIEQAGGALWSELVYVCLIGPVVEEILCRGLILNTLRRSFRPGWAITLCGVAFGLIHGNFYQFVFTMPFGVLLAYLAIRYDSIVPGIFMHAAFNASNYLVGLGGYLGYSEESAAFRNLYYAALIFLVASVPVAVVLFRRSWAARAEEIRSNPPEELYVPPVTLYQAPYNWQNPGSGTPFPPYTPYGYGAQNINQTTNQGNGQEEMAQIEWIVAGLGNPGANYAATRHNSGFIAMDYIALREHLPAWQAKFRALTAMGEIGGKKVLFMKPQTFMNLSGEAIREAAAFYKIPPPQILVLFDDINFEPGEIRIRKNGSAGGHNGIKSIIQNLGSEEFPRVKIGVGHVPESSDLMHWVLAVPNNEDTDRIVGSMEKVYSSAKLIVGGDTDRAMAFYNARG